MKKILFGLVLFLFLLVPTVSSQSVNVETLNYKISCYPETSTIKPVGFGYEQICEFKNKLPYTAEFDFAMLFDDPLIYGKVHLLKTQEQTTSHVYLCEDLSYGIVDAENVYCGEEIIYTGTERHFYVGDNVTVSYNLTNEINYWQDVTSFFNYYDAFFWDKNDAYYVENINWSSGESKFVKFNYFPSDNTKDVKWDAVFAEIDTGTLYLRLDPLTDPNLYEPNYTIEANYSDVVSISEDVLLCNITNQSTTFDSDLEGWGDFGAGTVIHSTADGGTMVVNDTAPGLAWACKYFNNKTGIVDIEARIKKEGESYSSLVVFAPNETNARAWVNPTSESKINFGGNSSNVVAVGDNYDFGNEGVENTSFKPLYDTYYKFRMVIDTNTDKADVYFNETLLWDDVDIKPLGNIDRVCVSGTGNNGNTFIHVDYVNYDTVDQNSCEFNSTNFEVAWKGVVAEYEKTSSAMNAVFNCGDVNATYYLNASTSGSLLFNCSDGTTDVNMTYSFNMSNQTSLTSFTLQNSESSSLNITFKDSETKTVVDYTNVSLEFIGSGFSNNYSTETGNIEITSISNDNYTLRYQSPIYPEKFYFYELIGNQDLTLFMTNISNSENVTVTVYDQVGEPVEGAFLKALRYDLTSNSYLLDESALTSFEGKVNFDLILYDEYYKFIVEFPVGTVIKETRGDYLTSTDLVINVNTADPVFGDFFDINGVNTRIRFLNSSDSFEFFYSDSNGFVEMGCLYVYTQNSLNGSLLYNSSCQSSSSATIFVGIENVNGSVYKAEAWLWDGEDFYFAGSLWKNYIASNIFGNIGSFLTILLLITFIFIGRVSLSISVILFSSGILFAKMIRILTISWEWVIGILIFGFIIIYLLSMRRSGE